MHYLLALAILVALPAFAQCDVSYDAKVSQNGKQYFTTTLIWNDLGQNGVQLLSDKAKEILAEAQKGNNQKGGSFVIVFSRQNTCSPTSPPDSATVQGLRWQDIAKILRVSTKAQLELLKAGDDNVAKGKSDHPWK